MIKGYFKKWSLIFNKVLISEIIKTRTPFFLTEKVKQPSPLAISWLNLVSQSPKPSDLLNTKEYWDDGLALGLNCIVECLCSLRVIIGIETSSKEYIQIK